MSIFVGETTTPRRGCCRVKIPRSDFNLNSLERSPAGHCASRVGGSHEVAHCCSLSASRSALLGWYSGYAKEAKGELRCEGAGAVIINVDGKDYAVNGMAGPRYPPIERDLEQRHSSRS